MSVERERVQVYVPWPEEQGPPEGWPETYVGEAQFRAVERERDELRAELAEIRESANRADGVLPRSWSEDVHELEALRAHVTELEEEIAGRANLMARLEALLKVPALERRVSELENAAREVLKACGHVEQWGQSGERAALMVLRSALLSDTEGGAE